MRFIDRTLLKVSTTWQNRADTLTLRLQALDQSNPELFRRLRNEVFENEIWKELKTVLGSLSNKKCWYCESKIDRNHGGVDHFRPKSGVTGEQDHLGYWWLAYESSNFRLSCEKCNSLSKHARGKQNQFPLLADSPRAKQLGQESYERVALIDPCVLAEHLLIIFDERGIPQPAISEATDSVLFHRVLESIRIYYLDKYSTCKNRQTLMDEVENTVRQILTVEEKLPKIPEPDRSELKLIIEDMKSGLVKKISPDSVFSIAAASVLINRRLNIPWADDLLRRGRVFL